MLDLKKMKKIISRKFKNGSCKNGERHSWRIEYGELEYDKRFVYRVDTHICIKCGIIKYISHKDMKA